MPTGRSDGRRGRLHTSTSAQESDKNGGTYPWDVGAAKAMLAELRPEEWIPHSGLGPLTDDGECLYGEISAEGLAKIFDWLAAAEECQDIAAKHPKAQCWPHGAGVFWDLGSAAGNAVVLAAMLRPFQLCGGVELQLPLHQAAQALGSAFAAEAASRLPFPAARLEFVHGDCRGSDGQPPCWAAADVVLVHATAFGAGLLGEVAQAAMHLRPGAWLVSVSKPVPGVGSGVLALEGQERFPMQYGTAEVYFQRRTHDDDDDTLAFELEEAAEDEALLLELLATGLTADS